VGRRGGEGAGGAPLFAPTTSQAQASKPSAFPEDSSALEEGSEDPTANQAGAAGPGKLKGGRRPRAGPGGPGARGVHRGQHGGTPVYRHQRRVSGGARAERLQWHSGLPLEASGKHLSPRSCRGHQTFPGDRVPVQEKGAPRPPARPRCTPQPPRHPAPLPRGPGTAPTAAGWAGRHRGRDCPGQRQLPQPCRPPGRTRGCHNPRGPTLTPPWSV